MHYIEASQTNMADAEGSDGTETQEGETRSEGAS
jgi:hypothetical protein